jgi:hypothetical protein
MGSSTATTRISRFIARTPSEAKHNTLSAREIRRKRLSRWRFRTF